MLHGLHSFRAGGATMIAKNLEDGNKEKLHGSWKSDISKDMYMQEGQEERLLVSKKLRFMMFCLTVTINKCTWNIDCCKKKKRRNLKLKELCQVWVLFANTSLAYI